MNIKNRKAFAIALALVLSLALPVFAEDTTEDTAIETVQESVETAEVQEEAAEEAVEEAVEETAEEEPAETEESAGEEPAAEETTEEEAAQELPEEPVEETAEEAVEAEGVKYVSVNGPKIRIVDGVPQIFNSKYEIIGITADKDAGEYKAKEAIPEDKILELEFEPGTVVTIEYTKVINDKETVDSNPSSEAAFDGVWDSEAHSIT